MIAAVDSSTLAGGFLELLFEDLTGWIEFRLIEERKGGHSRSRWFNSIPAALAALPAMQRDAEAEGRAMFFGVLPRIAKGKGDKAGIAPGWCAWVDIDWKHDSEDEYQTRIATLPPPSIVVRSGHGMHLYWLMREATDPAELEGLSRRISNAIGADHCHDAGRILRLPGSVNLKEGWAGGEFIRPAAAAVVVMPTCDGSRRYILDDFEFLPDVEDRPSAAAAVPRSRTVEGIPGAVARLLRKHGWLADLWDGRGRTSGDTSNSGYDLAFAGALTRCGIVDPDILDAAVRSRPYAATPDKPSRPERQVRRVVDRALADVASRAATAPQPATEPTDGPEGDDAVPPPDDTPFPGDDSTPLRITGEQPDPSVMIRLARKMRIVNGVEFPGRPYPSAVNVETVLTHDARWKKWLKYNDFGGRVEVDKKPRTDVIDTKVALWLHRVYDLELSTDRVAEVLVYVAQTRYRYDPLRDYLSALSWDGVKRIDTILQRAFAVETPDHAHGDELVSCIARCFFVSAVARAFDPGCKVDTQLVLVGTQGKGKSTALAALCPNRAWFSDTQIDMASKDRFQALDGVWLYENSEMDLLRGAALSRLKGFLTSQVDRYRSSYGRNVEDHPRRTVFLGSCNDREFVDDPTGMRRFMPLCVRGDGAMDVAIVTSERDQLWAEAVAMYRDGLPWHLDADGRAAMADHADGYRVVNAWEEPIQEFLTDPEKALLSHESGFHVNDVLAHLDIPLERRGEMRLVGRVTAILVAMGCRKERRRSDDGRQWRWFRPRA